MADVVPLTGLPGGRKRKPREWGIELVPVTSGPGPFPTSVRVALVDRESGKRLGSRVLPWEEFKDAAHNLVLVNVAEGVHE